MGSENVIIESFMDNASSETAVQASTKIADNQYLEANLYNKTLTMKVINSSNTIFSS